MSSFLAILRHSSYDSKNTSVHTIRTINTMNNKNLLVHFDLLLHWLYVAY